MKIEQIKEFIKTTPQWLKGKSITDLRGLICMTRGKDREKNIWYVVYSYKPDDDTEYIIATHKGTIQ